MEEREEVLHPTGSPTDPDSTAFLLARIREGDENARERLFARALPVLQRWAHGRLPAYARDSLDTDDLVQVTVLRAIVRLDEIEYRGEGAFLAYLRQVLLNAIRERIRRTGRRPVQVRLDEDLLADLERGPAALETIVGREQLRQYERALATLPPEMQQAVILRFEFGYAHDQIAEALGKPSADAARKMVARAVARLTRMMGAK